MPYTCIDGLPPYQINTTFAAPIVPKSIYAVIFYKTGSVSRKNSLKTRLIPIKCQLLLKPENGHLSQRIFVTEHLHSSSLQHIPRDYLSLNICTRVAYSISRSEIWLLRLPNTIDLGFFLNIGSTYSIRAGDVTGMIFVYHLTSMTQCQLSM